MRTSALTIILLLLVISATLGLAPLLAPSTVPLALPIPVPLEAVLTDALLPVLAQLLRVGASGCGIDTLVRVVLLGNLACGTDARLPLVGLGDQIALAFDHALAGVPVPFVSLHTITLVGMLIQFLGVSASRRRVDTFVLVVRLLNLASRTDAHLALVVGQLVTLALDHAFAVLVSLVAMGAFALVGPSIQLFRMSALRDIDTLSVLVLLLGESTNAHLPLIIGHLSVLAIQYAHLFVVLLVSRDADATGLLVVELLGMGAGRRGYDAFAMLLDLGSEANACFSLGIRNLAVLAVENTHLLVVLLVPRDADASVLLFVELFGVSAGGGSSLALAVLVDG